MYDPKKEQFETVPSGLLKVLIEDNIVVSSTFRYGNKYLERSNAIPVDITSLPLNNKEYITGNEFDIFTGIKDSCPDSWGKELENESIFDFEKIVKAYNNYTDSDIKKIEAGMKNYVLPGSSMGGARPKANCMWKENL